MKLESCQRVRKNFLKKTDVCGALLKTHLKFKHGYCGKELRVFMIIREMEENILSTGEMGLLNFRRLLTIVFRLRGLPTEFI